MRRRVLLLHLPEYPDWCSSSGFAGPTGSVSTASLANASPIPRHFAAITGQGYLGNEEDKSFGE